MCQDEVKHSPRTQSTFSLALCWVGGGVAEPDPCSSKVERMNQLQTEQATPDNKQDIKLTNHLTTHMPESLLKKEVLVNRKTTRHFVNDLCSQT